jgi:lysophospholipid acyltransferase (LPLAT)-like uncharacterized protein
MKIRHPTLIKAVGRAGAWAVRAWVGTLRYRYCPLGPDLDPRSSHLRGRYLYAFWHETLLLPACKFGGLNTRVLISEHADGELIAEILRHLRFGAIRGSTTRGGVKVVRQALALEGNPHLAVTPDGPRGPRRRVQRGVVYLSSRLGLPIVPAGFGFERPWRMKSWDRFAVPRPFTRARCVTCEPILVPPTAERDLLEQYRHYVERCLLDVTEQAERWAEDGVAPVRRVWAPPPAERKLAG